MPDVRLSEPDQRVLQSLLSLEPLPGEPLPGQRTFEMLNRLVRCDSPGRCLLRSPRPRHQSGRRDASGRPRQHHRHHGSWQDRSEHDGPFHLGVMRWREHPAQAERCGNVGGPGEGVAIGYRNGTEAIVQYWFHRDDRLFNDRDLAVLYVLGPVLRRLVRERPTPRLPTTITLTERRVLSHVAAGRSNAQIAETLCISVSTVRKHLENAYRKLGVGNRVAAIARLRGSDEPSLDLRGRLDRYA